MLVCINSSICSSLVSFPDPHYGIHTVLTGGLGMRLVLVSCQTPPSHEEEGLVTIEHFLLCWVSSISSEQTNETDEWLLAWHTTKEVPDSHKSQTIFFVREWGLGTRLQLLAHGQKLTTHDNVPHTFTTMSYFPCAAAMCRRESPPMLVMSVRAPRMRNISTMFA